jgi:hypothetical protein
MRRIVIGISVFVFVLVGCTPLASPPPGVPSLLPETPTPSPAPHGKEVVKESTQSEQVQLNTCNGEQVTLGGEVRRETKTKDSTIEEHVDAHLTGIGDQGNEYEFKVQIKSKVDSETFVVKFSDKEMLVSKGSAPNQRVTVEISSPPFTFDMETDCTG